MKKYLNISSQRTNNNINTTNMSPTRRNIHNKKLINDSLKSLNYLDLKIIIRTIIPKKWLLK
jgi:hypothetical protein